MNVETSARHARGPAGGSPPGNADAGWSVRLAGEARVESTDGRRVPLEQRDAAMIGFLAIEGTCSRTHMVSMLWSDAAIGVLRGRLRQRLYSLRQRLGCEVVAGGETLALSPCIRWVGLDAEDERHALLGDVDLPELADWLSGVRERWRLRRQQRLAERAAALESEGRLAEAIVAAQGMLQSDPLLETAHRALMRLHALRGDRAAALSAFDRCERALKEGLGAPPDAHTLALLASIEHARPLAGLPAKPARRAVPASVTRPPRLIGRDTEWARLQAAWERGDAIVVVGEAGMGKTRLIQDLVGPQAGQPGSVLQATARPGDERMPYALLGRLLRTMLAARTGMLREGVEAELSLLLPELPQRRTDARQDDAAARARLLGAVESVVVDAIGEGLQAVVLDDLHFADAASLELSRHLVGIPGVRWLAAFRPAEIGDAGRELVDSLVATRHAEPLLLRPLDAAESGLLLQALQIGIGDTDGLAEALHRRTGGNPLFILETVKALLVQQAGARPGWAHADALSCLPADGGIGRLITRRLDQLSPDAIALARCAAIAGQDFSAMLAEHVFAHAGTHAGRPVGRTRARAGLPRRSLRARPGARRGACIGARVHRDCPCMARSRRTWPPITASRPAWPTIGNRPPALNVPAPPGSRLPACAPGAAGAPNSVQVLERAAAAFAQAADGRRQFDALLERAQVLGQHAELASALVALEQAAAVAGDDRDRLRLAVVGLYFRGYHGEDPHVLAQAPAALALARRLGERHSEFTLTTSFSGALARTGRAHESIGLMAAQHAWVHAHGTPEHAYEYWNSTALALDYGSRMHESMQAWEASRQVAQQHFPDLLSQATGNMAYTSAKMGDVRRAVDLASQALDLARKASDGFDHQVLEQQLALGHHQRNIGHYAEAVHLLEAAAAGFRTGGRELRASTAEYLLSVAWSQLGQSARALRLTAAESGAPMPRVRAMRLAFRALALHAAGQDGRAAIREALALFDEPGSLWYRTHTLIATDMLPPEEGLPMARALTEWALAHERFGLALAAESRAARCALALGQAHGAVPHVERALQLAQQYQPDAFYLPEMWCVAADVLAATGQQAARRQALEDGTRWVAQVCAGHVPLDFRESFLHRNPVNRRLLSLGAEVSAAAF